MALSTLSLTRILPAIGPYWVTGMEGYAMWLLTKFGAPTPWPADEVQVYLAKVREQSHP